MNEIDAINILENKCSEKNIGIRYEKGDFEGGFCILRDSQVIVINKKLADLRKVIVLSEAMERLGILFSELPLDLQILINEEKPKRK